MSPAFVLLQVFQASKRLGIASVAVRNVAVQQITAGGMVLLVNFSLVTKQSARVSEALRLVTARFETFVWSIMLVHVLAGRGLAFRRSIDRNVTLTSIRKVCENLGDLWHILNEHSRFG